MQRKRKCNHWIWLASKELNGQFGNSRAKRSAKLGRASEERDEYDSLEKKKKQNQKQNSGESKAPLQLLLNSTSFHESRSRSSEMPVSRTAYLRQKITLTAVSGAEEKA